LTNFTDGPIIRGDLPLLNLAAAELLLSSNGLIKPGYWYYYF